MSRSRLVVLASGSGSNLQAILDACAGDVLDAEVVAVVSDRPGAVALDRARRVGIEAIAHPVGSTDRRTYDGTLADVVAAADPDWVVLAGWMRILTSAFLDRFPNRVVNLHPALPGAFPGVRAIERAHAAAERGEISETGVMVHLVPDEGVDTGPVLGSASIPLVTGQSLAELTARVHAVEHRLLVDVLRGLTASDTPVFEHPVFEHPMERSPS